MFRPRIIPVLLLRDRVLIKSTRFRGHRYIGDPINAVRIFNDSRADELVFLDIDATRQGRLVPLEIVRDVGEEARMPFAVGGGIRSIADVRQVLGAGAEKVVIGAAASDDPDFVRHASEEFGSSTIVVCMDVKKQMFRGPRVWSRNGTRMSRRSPIEFAQLMESSGAGELIVQSIERDGRMGGYDVELVRSVADAVTIPVVALGGAGSNEDLIRVHEEGHANALAAGSLFVYQGANRGVLINYPEKGELMFDLVRNTDGR